MKETISKKASPLPQIAGRNPKTLVQKTVEGWPTPTKKGATRYREKAYLTCQETATAYSCPTSRGRRVTKSKKSLPEKTDAEEVFIYSYKEG